MTRFELCDLVHYVSFGTPGGEYGQRCRAAIVTEVCEPGTLPDHVPGREWSTDVQLASLCVLSPTGLFMNERVPRHAPRPPLGGTCHTRDECPAT